MSSIVIGAGPAGLALAIARLQRDASVTLLEQRSEGRFITDAGGAYELTARTLKHLDTLGVLASVRARGTELARFQLRSMTGASLQDLPFARAGFTVFAITRAELQRALLERFTELGGRIRYGAQLTAVQSLPTAVVASLESGETIEGDVLVGADGMHSRVRRMVFDPAPPVDVGIAALWGHADVDALPVARGESLGWIGRGRSLVVASAGRADAPRLLFTLCVATDPSPLDRNTHFQTLPPSLAPLFASMRDVAETRLYAQPALNHHAQKRVALIGDAAHGMPPFLGLGANLAVEDAVLVDAAIHEGALDAFGRSRAMQIAPRIPESRRLGAMMHARSPLGSALFATITKLIPSALVIRQMRVLHTPEH